MKTLTDHSGVLLRISEGDEKAYGAFFDHYYTILKSFVFKFTKSEEDTEEVLQDTFVRVWLYRDKLLEIENMDAWIYKVASRECLSFLRRTYSERHTITNLEGHDFADNKAQTPLEVVNLKEIHLLVKTAVERMPAQRKRIYQLSRDEGMKPAEIAETLSLSVSTVKNVLSSSLKEIRAYLASSGFDISALICILIKFI